MRRAWPGIAARIIGAIGLCLSGCLATPPSGTQVATPQETVSEAGELVEPARALAGLYKPGEIRGFTFIQVGDEIGRSYGRYDGPVERDGQTLHRFTTQVELLPPGGKPLRFAAELLIDERGDLVEGWERSMAAELRFEVKPEQSLLHIQADAGLSAVEQAELSYEPGTAYMGYMSTIHEELMLALRELRVGDNEWRLISLSAGRADPWSAKVERQGDTVVLDTSLGEEIWLENGRITRIEVPDDELVVTSMAHPQWPDWEVTGPTALTYKPPPGASFSIREVELPGQADDPVLRGDVLVPDPAVHGPGPHPGVVFLGGSVSADRYGFAGPPAVDLGYHEITDALANAGFVVLRYDERGAGQSEDAKPSWVGQRTDARRAFRTLLVQPEVDPDRIIAVGHAEGGWRALSLAAERPREVIGVALLATLGRSYRELFAAQKDILEALETGKGLPKQLQPMADWYGEILVEDPEALVFRALVPMWIAQGGKDFETDPVKDLAALTAAVRKYKRDATIERFPDLDHHFKHEDGVSNQTSYLDPRPVDKDFLAALVQWTEGIAAKAGAKSRPNKPNKSKAQPTK
ncbi:alpha/beta hydrolase family protein [Enhygromyxa salina]|uniref:Alpha/beta hydrolase family protein n=1 Tax=Enhygromyxa salina TaxID=215803 RepID=A0A2S9YI87_9BACT|nr:alpha/beta hydrolase [Enhygromyxa salina]PRQ04824.1 Alpha/beta hydrolase family protein [Enhygromyxa salina]